MMRQPNDLKALQRNCKGATAIEYAMIVLFIVIGLVAALLSIGSTVSTFFNSVGTGL